MTHPKTRASTPAPTAPVAPADANGASASPVARRIAAQEGVDLGSVQGSARGGRITKADVLAAAANGGTVPAADAPAAEKPAGAQPIRGGGAALARYMDESRSIPTATSFRTLAVTTLDERRQQLKARGAPRLVHPPDRVRDRAGRRPPRCR